MMNHLATGPSPVAIRCIELFVGETFDRAAQQGWSICDPGDPGNALIGCRHPFALVLDGAGLLHQRRTEKLTVRNPRKIGVEGNFFTVR